MTTGAFGGSRSDVQPYRHSVETISIGSVIPFRRPAQAQRGVPLEQLSEVMGHSSLMQTQRYAQIIEPLRCETAARMDGFMLGGD